VWTGQSHPLTEVACNDDYDNPPLPQSYVAFDAVAGTTYSVRVCGAGNAEGTLFLMLRSPTQVGTQDPDYPAFEVDLLGCAGGLCGTLAGVRGGTVAVADRDPVGGGRVRG
jgi:hypothetical protein